MALQHGEFYTIKISQQEHCKVGHNMPITSDQKCIMNAEVPKVTLTFLHEVTTKFKMPAPKSIGIWPDPRQVFVPGFKLVAEPLCQLSSK